MGLDELRPLNSQVPAMARMAVMRTVRNVFMDMLAMVRDKQVEIFERGELHSDETALFETNGK